ncbi:MAG: hypothetical protein R3E89_07260 [Thiolinea sp.]
MLELTELEELPAGFFELSGPAELHTLMPNPTLVHLPGRVNRACLSASCCTAMKPPAFSRYRNCCEIPRAGSAAATR